MRGTTRSCIHFCLEPLSEANVRLSMKEFSRKGNVHDIGKPIKGFIASKYWRERLLQP